MRQKAVTDDLYPEYLANVLRVRAAACYRDALRIAERCPALLDVLGEPLEAELPTGGITFLNEGSAVEREVTRRLLAMTFDVWGIADPMGDAEKYAHFSVVLRGPQGEGKLIVFASGIEDNWTFHSLDVEIEGREDRIPLLPAEA